MSIVRTATGSIDITDMGVTIRTLLAVAADGYKETQRRKWSVKYKGAVIGWLQVKDDHLKLVKGKKHDTRRNDTTPATRQESVLPIVGMAADSTDCGLYTGSNALSGTSGTAAYISRIVHSDDTGLAGN